jgi:hypothetical protein
MSKQENNAVMKNARGMFAGQVVFKIRKGVAVLAGPPTVNKDRVLKPGEAERRNDFKLAIIYAKAAIKDPVKKAAYDAAAIGGQTAYNVACRDWHKAPEILEVHIEKYTGQIGDTISVDAVDDVLVTEVRISVSTPAGQLIEEGTAVQGEDGLTWVYTTTVANANLAGTRISATAIDMPRNTVSEEVIL